MTRRPKRGPDWSRATRAMPASFADQPRRDAPVEGRRDDGLDLVEAVTGAAALAAIARLASDDVDAPPPGDAVSVDEEDVVVADDAQPPEAATDDADDEEDD